MSNYRRFSPGINPLADLVNELGARDTNVPLTKTVLRVADERNILVDFRRAAEADDLLFGRHGPFWASAFGYPKKGDVVEIERHHGGYVPYMVNFVGAFTFSVRE